MHVRLRHRVSEDFAVTKRLRWVDFTLKHKSPVSGTVCIPKASPRYVMAITSLMFLYVFNQPVFLLLILQNPETGKYEFRYIFVDMDVYPRRTIIVEDNR